jgi:hypothetical protein
MDRESWLLITNNPLLAQHYDGVLPLAYQPEWRYLDVLLQARDRVQQGWRLLTHPLAGSVKPFQTPYRSLLLGRSSLVGDMTDDVLMIENSIAAYHRQMQGKRLPQPEPATARDFAVVDMSLIQGALDR